MSSVTKQVSGFLNKYSKGFRKMTQNRLVLEKLGRIAVNRVQTRTRLGRGVRHDEGPEGKFINLSKSYVDFRSGRVYFFKKNGKTIAVRKKKGKKGPKIVKPVLDSTTSNGRKTSNLTFTGQMLRSIKHRVIARRSTVLLNLTGTRKDGKTNEQVARYHEGEGRVHRPFFHLSAKDYRKITSEYRKFLRRYLKRLNR